MFRCRGWMGAGMGLALATTAVADCPSEAEAFAELVDIAESAPSAASFAMVETAMRCLQVVPERPDLARAYVVLGRKTFDDTQRYAGAVYYFCAAKSTQSDLVPAPSVVPTEADHRVRVAWEARCPLRQSVLDTNIEPWVDGVQTTMVPGIPTVQPVLIQYQNEDGSWSSQLVDAGGVPSVPRDPPKRRERWVAPTIGVVALVGFGIGLGYAMSINGRNPGNEEW